MPVLGILYIMIYKKPTVLCILDGWGLSDTKKSNAIAAANTPNWDQWQQDYSMAKLEASGEAVGLPRGQMGNSEVGHMTIGAGRQILQDLPLINQAIKENKIVEKPSWKKFIEKIKSTNNACHLMGLFSPGGIHSHQDHYLVFANLLSREGIKVYLHLFLDGRDTPPKSADVFVEKAINKIKENCEISTISGRFYAMDRDKRWDRTEMAYKAITKALGPKYTNPLNYIKESYDKNISDEFILPAVSKHYEGVKNGDAFLIVNFRADRVRQLLSSLVLPDFKDFSIDRKIKWSTVLGMKEYSETLSKFIPSLFPYETPKNTLGEVVATAGKSQLRVAETEKYAHVTFFLNGGYEKTFKNEKRILIPSPKVRTYDLQPEMSAQQLTQQVKTAIQSKKIDLIVVNYANPDMVGHTGNFNACVRAVEVVDNCLGDLVDSTLSAEGTFIITSDHGNIEQLIDIEANQPHTSHTTNLVPFILLSKNNLRLRDVGTLADVAPTVLDIIHIEKPIEMTGKSLIIES
jgi:2,3-bisphosphoglycerate-independent phosphoglycerate mutase